MKESGILFSIISVNYNDKAGLQRTIESVLAQRFEAYEHIIIDGGSTDGSVELIRTMESRYSAGKLRWISEKDSGIYDAMNKGVSMAHGQFLNMMNAGDWLQPDALHHIAQSIEKNPDIQVFAGLQKLYDEVNGEMIPVQMAQIYPRALCWHVMYHQAMFYHASLHQEYGLYRQDLKLASDQAFILEIFVRQKVSFMLVEHQISNFVTGGRGDKWGRQELFYLRKDYFMPKKSLLEHLFTAVKWIVPYGLVILLWKALKKDFPNES